MRGDTENSKPGANRRTLFWLVKKSNASRPFTPEDKSFMQIYHNPRCSKSRQTLALLNEHGIEPEIVLYLENPPDATALKSIIKKLGINARDLLRKGEAEYREQGLADASLSESKLIDAMCRFPKLIERPIVIRGNSAVLGRPPENVLELID